MDLERILARSQEIWDDSILPTLTEYIRIPNLSPAFDPDWKAHGHMHRAVDLLMAWAQDCPIHGLAVEMLERPDRTPIILIEAPGDLRADDDTILIYGHLDKQPATDGWREGLSAWEPVREGDKLYGRGGADDGYALFASLAALMVLEEQDLPYARIVIIIEGSEESGSPDLPAYIEAYKDHIGTPSLTICLDSGCGTYDRLWMTTSLRGIVIGDLTVRMLTQGVHSGAASGVVPDPYQIASVILDRFPAVPEHMTEVPEDRLMQATAAAEILGDAVHSAFPWAPGAVPFFDSNLDLLIGKTWDATITITGMDGLPSLDKAGTEFRPYLTLRCAIRTPPTIDAAVLAAAVKRDFENEPPHGAQVSFTVNQAMSGWNAPSLAPWLEESVEGASQAFFGKPFMALGEGGTIPFMGMLGAMFPETQFVITGVLGPGSNAHGPNEFLHIPMGVRLTASVAKIITDHATR